MPQRLLLGNGQEHIVGEPVAEDPAPEQVADAHEALTDGTAEPAEPEVTPCVTAFTVYLVPDGEVFVSFTPWTGPEPARKPTFDEMYHGAAVLIKHISDYTWSDANEVDTATCAFTPYLTEDGRWLISANSTDPLVPQREATRDELIGGLAVVQRDIHTQEILGPVFGQFAQSLTMSITQNVIGNMINMGQQAASAQEALKVAEQLEKDKMRRGGGGRKRRVD